MLAKAVAHHTTASFIRCVGERKPPLPSLPLGGPLSSRIFALRSVVGSEFVQKYLGEGPRMVRDVFRMARENAPSIIFMDEIDSIATKRFDSQMGGAAWLPSPRGFPANTPPLFLLSQRTARCNVSSWSC